MELSDLLLIPLGMAVGAFGTLVGAGGGFILVPVLLLLYPDEDPKTLTATSLLVVLLNAVSGSIAYGRQKRIDYHSGKWFALATLPGAVGGATGCTAFEAPDGAIRWLSPNRLCGTGSRP